MELAPDEREAACSFSVTGFNAGIGGGALCGGVVLGAAGPYAVLAWSAGIALLALLVLWAGRFVVSGRKQAERGVPIQPRLLKPLGYTAQYGPAQAVLGCGNTNARPITQHVGVVSQIDHIQP